jgi:hypothetical protein
MPGYAAEAEQLWSQALANLMPSQHTILSSRPAAYGGDCSLFDAPGLAGGVHSGVAIG